jgi:moderate conductance mechanosensitive channel
MIKAVDTGSFIENVNREVSDFLARPNDYRAVLVLIFSIAFSYWVSHFLAKGIIYIAQRVAVRSDTETREDRIVVLRQVETYLSVAVAVVRAAVVAIVAYVTWRILTPQGSDNLGGSGAAAIGASAFFIVFAGATLGILLRDITAGATMIIEKWFTIGDFIKVEPFIDVSGVVERMTLRATKLRSLSGEIVWIHNQQIQAVHVSPRGVRTMAVDIFVHDVEAAEKAIKKVANAVPTGATMLARPLKVNAAEQWGEDLWRIVVTGETTPGRDWLIEQFFVNAIKALDEGKKKSEKLLVYEPIARFADPVADKRFKRAVRVGKDK